MGLSYPNLPLIEEKFRNIIKEQTNKVREEAKKQNRIVLPEYSVKVFRQLFENSLCVFDDGKAQGASLPAHMYITIIYDALTGMSGVFGGNRIAYLVEQDETFAQDVAHCKIATLQEAEGKYKNTTLLAV